MFPLRYSKSKAIYLVVDFDFMVVILDINYPIYLHILLKTDTLP